MKVLTQEQNVETQEVATEQQQPKARVLNVEEIMTVAGGMLGFRGIGGEDV